PSDSPTLSLHDALPISCDRAGRTVASPSDRLKAAAHRLLQFLPQLGRFVKEQGAIGLDPISIISSQQTRHWLVANLAHQVPERKDRKSTRLNSSHVAIS